MSASQVIETLPRSILTIPARNPSHLSLISSTRSAYGPWRTTVCPC